MMAFPASGVHYTDLFYQAMREHGARIVPGYSSGLYLLNQLKHVDFLHIHWPSFLYARKTKPQTIYAFSIFVFLLILARARGIRVIWTIHNLFPHTPTIIPSLDRLARWLMVLVSHRFLVHGQTAMESVLQTFPKTAGRITQIEFGHYISLYPNDISRGEARKRLTLAHDTQVLLFFGECLPYKNLEGLIGTFSRLPQNVHLLIVGRFHNISYQTKIKAQAAASSPRIQIYPNYVPNEELQIYLRASDLIVAPYHKTLSSATTILAMSFGRPMVSPRMSMPADYITEECGVLYDPDDLDGLYDALMKALATEFNEERIIREARSHDWNKSAESLIEILAAADNK